MVCNTTDIMNKLKEYAMEAQLPSQLPTKMKEKFLELSHKMTPGEIAEVGEKFREAHVMSMEEWKKSREKTVTE